MKKTQYTRKEMDKHISCSQVLHKRTMYLKRGVYICKETYIYDVVV